ncbi:hypothetical protein N9231_06285, partial [Saprospiraceae bacterium]|nr:hypothetical protein [Saprospiraceae bacterium]
MKSRTHYGMKDGTVKQMFYRVRLLWDRNFELDQYPNSNWKAEGRSNTPRVARPSGTNVPTNQASSIGTSSSGKKSLTIKRR